MWHALLCQPHRSACLVPEPRDLLADCLAETGSLSAYLLPQAPQRYLVGVRLGTRLLSTCRAKNQKLASTAAAQQALDVLESEESQAEVLNSL